MIRGLWQRFEELVWGTGLYQYGLAGRILSGMLRQLYAVTRDIISGQLTLRSMSLVYTTLLSMVPLLALSFSILKGFGVQNQLDETLHAALAPLGEDKALELTENLITFVNNMNVGVLGAVGLPTEAVLTIVEDKAQLEKVREMRKGFTFFDKEYGPETVKVQHIVVMNPEGIESADDWESLADLEARGKEKLAETADERSSRAAEPNSISLALCSFILSYLSMANLSSGDGSIFGMVSKSGLWLALEAL